MNILVYSDCGTSPNAVNQAVHCLHTLLGQSYTIAKTTSLKLCSEPWEDTCALLVVPGGRDLPYCRDLAGEGNRRIRNYVTGGGRYLGLCAGAYYGCGEIEFEKDRPGMAICGPRELGFFPGLCRGTVFPGFVYNSELGARSVTIKLEAHHLQPYYAGSSTVPPEIKMYYNGGGYFVHADSNDGTTVLGRYKDPGICEDEEAPAAIIHCRVGQGHAMLIGPHPEYSVSLTEEEETIHGQQSSGSVFGELLLSESAREQLISALLARMELNVYSSYISDQDVLIEEAIQAGHF